MDTQPPALNQSAPPSVAVIGTGAIGGYYGALLAKAGFPTHFLLRSDYKHVQKHGLRVDSMNGDFTLSNPTIYQNAADMPPCDCVLVCLKSTENAALEQILPAVTHANSAVILIQNGLGAEPETFRHLPTSAHLYGALAFICSNKIGPGHIQHVDYGKLVLARFLPDYTPAGIDAKLEQLVHWLSTGGIQAHAEGNLLLARWKKLAWNIPYNGLSVLLDAQTDALMANPHTRALITTLMREVQAGARACNCDLDDGFITGLLAYTEKMAPYKTSMMLDFQNGRPLELDMLFAQPIAFAQAHGQSMPVTEALLQSLHFLATKN